jgi:hypothetical protein
LASTSESLGTYLLRRLKEHGFETEKTYATVCVSSDRNREILLKLVDSSDLLILAFPLYADSLPSRLVATLELIADHRRNEGVQMSQRLLAIVNSGFPEAKQNDTALAICRCFAHEAGMDWAGGLALGGGAMIAGRPLSKLRGRVRNVTKALDITAAAIAQDEPVPKQAVELMAKPMLALRLYVWMANRGWNLKLKQYGTRPTVYDQPYLVNT